MDGSKDGDGDVYQLSAVKLWQSVGSSEMEPAWKYPALRASYCTIDLWEWIVAISCVGTTAADQGAGRFTNISFFLLDVAITNAYILMMSSGRPCPFKDFKSFRLQLAKELIGEYCSR